MKRLQLLLVLAFANSITFAQPNATLFSASAQWQNTAQRLQILETTPSWQQENINTIAKAFYQADAQRTYPSIEHNHYNVDFINSHWGPKSNPYVKFQRPAKLFVFIGDDPKVGDYWDETNDNYFIAPIIKNAADHHIYVFEKDARQPIPVNDWVNGIIKQYPKNTKISINVCDGYATAPNENCEETHYQNEAWYVYNDFADDAGAAVREIHHTSAKRDPQVNWQDYIGSPSLIDDDSPLGTRVDANDNDAVNKLLANVPEWKNHSLIESIFKTIRDKRYFGDKFRPGFLRRISWLMPQDGCWSRMSAFIKDFFGPANNPVTEHQRPAKIFAFGNLCVNTPYDEDGYASWWYHTAPVIRDAETKQTYVLDPAVDASKPMLVNDWMKAISANTGACAENNSSINTVSICDGTSYAITPRQSCHYTGASMESYGMLDQILYLNFENSLMDDLGLNGDDLLGEHPPWE